MYNRDVKRIRKYVETNGPEGFLHVGTFVLTTIQTPLSRTLDQVKDIKHKGKDSEALWGFKRKGYQELLSSSDELYHALVDHTEKLEWAIFRLLSITGLGLAKASFLLQCLGYPIGCVDGHNLKIYNLNPKDIMVDKALTVDKTLEKVYNYISICESIGGSEVMWNNWVTYVACNRMNRKLDTADKVSSFHYEAISV